MGKLYTTIEPRLQTFIEAQKLFFVATAGREGRVNVSPKGMDTLRILEPNRILWLNLTGSGNETAAHVLENGRMTLMFCAFEDRPMILRLYGQATVYHPRDTEWRDLTARFPNHPGSRQLFDMTVDSVQTSCGFGVPRFDYLGDRDELVAWAARKGEDGIHSYWQEKNQESLDGMPTHILAEGAKPG